MDFKRTTNPCIACGACCAFFRVQFYWREANNGEQPEASVNEVREAVPATMFEELDERHRCMKGTADKHHPKCVGLAGRIGRDAKCSIYTSRPSPCRDFTASFANGQRNKRCDEARRAHGLKPLTPGDWPKHLVETAP